MKPTKSMLLLTVLCAVSFRFSAHSQSIIFYEACDTVSELSWQKSQDGGWSKTPRTAWVEQDFFKCTNYAVIENDTVLADRENLTPYLMQYEPSQQQVNKAQHMDNLGSAFGTVAIVSGAVGVSMFIFSEPISKDPEGGFNFSSRKSGLALIGAGLGSFLMCKALFKKRDKHWEEAVNAFQSKDDQVYLQWNGVMFETHTNIWSSGVTFHF